MNIVLGVCGSIAAYKAVDVMRLFLKQGHGVSVILTRGAREFITPLTFATFIPGRVFGDMFNDSEDPLRHINLGRDNELLLVAPASADVIGKMAGGIADDLLTSTYLAFPGKVVVSPAMNTNMYAHPAVQENLQRLRQRGVAVLEPEEGSLACRVEGKGRFPTAETIYQFCMGISHV